MHVRISRPCPVFFWTQQQMLQIYAENENECSFFQSIAILYIKQGSIN